MIAGAALLWAALGAAAPPAAPPAPVPAPWTGGPLEVLADGRVAPLGRPADVQSGDAQAGPARVERVDLVWGCRGDRARAVVVEGGARLGQAPRDACAARVDVRAPCAPGADPGVDPDAVAADDADDADDAAPGAPAPPAATAAWETARAAHRRLTGTLAAGFAEWGPGLRLVVSGGGPLWLRSSRLELESCGCDGDIARALGDEPRLLTLPRLAGPTVVWVPIPRYTGAVHRLSARKPPAPGTLGFTDPFHASDDPAGDDWERPAPGPAPVAEAFSAPAGCDCAPCEAME